MVRRSIQFICLLNLIEVNTLITGFKKFRSRTMSWLRRVPSHEEVELSNMYLKEKKAPGH